MLTSSNEPQNISYEEAQNLPNLTRDISRVQNIEMPSKNIEQSNPLKYPMTGHALYDHLTIEKMVTLGNIPGERIKFVTNLIIDGNKLFVTYIKVSDDDEERFKHYHAVFDMKGKFLTKFDMNGSELNICRKTKEVYYMKLDGNPVNIFLERMTTEKVGMKEYIKHYKKKGMNLTEKEVRQILAERPERENWSYQQF